MPVHVREADGYLRLVVDGDFTPGELERVGAAELSLAFEADDLSVLLDCSGAAGLERKDPSDYDRIATFLGAIVAAPGRVAFLAPGGQARERLDGVARKVRELGTEASVFRIRSEAEAWLDEG